MDAHDLPLGKVFCPDCEGSGVAADGGPCRLCGGAKVVDARDDDGPNCEVPG